ncbi:hypothetical protein IAD21_02310 [Abditibacteriota bacterium]|nr:hypothetical protein IAD21_02310 [Abditibacteriota bacterium]
MPQCAWGKTQTFAREISFRLLKIPVAHGAAVLSPNGRWLAVSSEASKVRGTVFYDFQSGHSWTDSRGEEPLAWSKDSRVCLSRSSREWRVATPERCESHSILRQPLVGVPGFLRESGIAAWTPRTRRLVIADGEKNTQIRLWNGRQWTRGIDWGRVLKFPEWYQGEVAPFDLTWSRDERLLTIRFYGRAERAEGSALHTVVFAVRGRKLKDVWGEDTGEVAWLDERRMMFKGDDGGMGGATDLVVAEPRTKRRRVWKTNVLAWALSPRRDFVCALLGNGDLVRSSTRRPVWQVIQKRALSRKIVTSNEVSTWFQLDVSPRGDMVAISRVLGGRGVWLFSTQPQKPWTIYWKSPTDSIGIVGWAQGRSLPLVQMGQGQSDVEDAPTRLGQLQKSSSL